MTVLMAGCGDLGTEAGLRFAAAGHRVLGWRRRPQNLPAGIEGSAVDLTRALPPVPPETRIVVVAAAAGQRTVDAYRAAYVDVLTNVLDALDRDRVRPERILVISSTAVYGDSGGDSIDESTPAEPTTATAKVLRTAEELLHSRHPDAVVLRLAGIYGPGRTMLIDQVRNGTARHPDQPQFTNRIHRDDAAAAIVHLTTRVSEPANMYIGVDDCPAELGNVLGFLAAELGQRMPPKEAGPAGAPGAAPRANKRCSNALLRSTGFEFAYPSFREGYRAILAGQGTRHR
ncbi:NAD-dependent epimerase/dehydratase family protein [Paeniglutamicibacter antarcticus]|uniref:NAD-dependent epimerase/dehydratase family protein n=1 Tax=Arthrobacter terrae TaxID=2935737 RepID=A0A931CNB2_9MICC|nr:NAD-dependent epimerase/dehydratase family protein [Arthrobacter terrae]MBG0739071.1 NAD-dependent epimerase/dehydratase family protein [Arthrobacter terrae]